MKLKTMLNNLITESPDSIWVIEYRELKNNKCGVLRARFFNSKQEAESQLLLYIEQLKQDGWEGDRNRLMHKRKGDICSFAIQQVWNSDTRPFGE